MHCTIGAVLAAEGVAEGAKSTASGTSSLFKSIQSAVSMKPIILTIPYIIRGLGKDEIVTRIEKLKKEAIEKPNDLRVHLTCGTATFPYPKIKTIQISYKIHQLPLCSLIAITVRLSIILLDTWFESNYIITKRTLELIIEFGRILPRVVWQALQPPLVPRSLHASCAA